DGIAMKKEELLLGVLEKNQGLVLVGGGSSVTEVSGPGWVGVDGEVFTDGAAVILFKTNVPWAALRHHAYVPTGQRVRITKIDVMNRRILEFDDRPAGRRWAELLDVPPEHLTMAHLDKLFKYGFAMKVGREYFMRWIYKSLESDTLESVNWLQED